MRRIIVISLILFIMGFKWNSNNDTCIVKIESINERYEGDCRKGLAHGIGKAWGKEDYYEGEFKKGYPNGKGVYQWENGNTYTGEFTKGKITGQGEMVIRQSGSLQDSVLTGYFKDGKYVGKYKEPYKIISDQGIRNIQFQKKAGELNQVSFMIYSNGQIVKPSLTIKDQKNTRKQDINGYPALVNIFFPLEYVEVSFDISPMSYKLIFEIYEEANWTVVISV